MHKHKCCYSDENVVYYRYTNAAPTWECSERNISTSVGVFA
nr:MAG TPA: hypothetical protein [Caudoviricetes sp.]DAW68557.1 MAG TPA: hypothetical protein [Caudoviricetes sp.]